jgi:hypothetical protein
MAAGGKRPFWMHQLVEYVLGGLLVASGLQSPTPLAPSLLGGLIMLNAALTKGALGAFRAYGRGLHRVFDIIIIGFGLVLVGQPWISIVNGTRIVMLGIISVHIVVFFGSSYVERQRTPKSAPSTETRTTTQTRTTTEARTTTEGRTTTEARTTTDERGTTGDRATDLGKSAGRMVGSGVNVVRKWRSGSSNGNGNGRP